MPFNGAGVFSRLFNFQQDRDNNIKILADRMDAELDGFATGLSNTIARDGQSTVSANIPFNNRKITGLGNATDPGDALNRATGDARYILDDDDTVKTPNIEDGAVTNAKLADMAEATIKGREAGSGSGPPVDLTGAQVAEILSGLIPAIPTASSGAGQFVLIDTSAAVGDGYGLPSGGTWAYFAFRVNNSTGAVPGGNAFAGVAAGGTSVISGLSGHYLYGFAWRIA